MLAHKVNLPVLFCVLVVCLSCVGSVFNWVDMEMPVRAFWQIKQACSHAG